MTETPAAPAAREVSLGEATRGAWQANPTGLTRYAGFAAGALIMLGVHVAMIVVTGNVWSWLAVVALPPAAYFIFVGWVYGRLSWRFLGLLLFVLGAMVPFYLM